MDINLILEEIEANHNKYKNGEIINQKDRNQYSIELLQDTVKKTYRFFKRYENAICEEYRTDRLLNRLEDKELKSFLIEEKEIAYKKGEKYSNLAYHYALQSIFIFLGMLEYIDDKYIKTYDCPDKFWATPVFDVSEEFDDDI